MGKQTSAGAVIGLSAAAPATNNLAGYAALTFTDVGEVTQLGDFGPEFGLVTHEPLASRGVEKYKGNFNPGAMTIQGAADKANAGQALLETAVADDDEYFVKVTFQGGEIVYFPTKVMSLKNTAGASNQMFGFSSNLEIIGRTATTTFIWDI
jgi:hypothetical protein